MVYELFMQFIYVVYVLVMYFMLYGMSGSLYVMCNIAYMIYVVRV